VYNSYGLVTCFTLHVAYYKTFISRVLRAANDIVVQLLCNISIVILVCHKFYFYIRVCVWKVTNSLFSYIYFTISFITFTALWCW